MSVALGIADIENGTLNKVNNVRPNKLFTADESIILYRIGTLRSDKLDTVIAAVIDMFQK